jgi:glycine hydroxymethyltransferase
VSLVDRGLTGKAMEQALDKAGITVNKNAVPFDPQPPMVTSGFRVGTPAVTTRGFGPGEMAKIASWIGRVAKSPEDETELARIKAEVLELCKAFPLYGDFKD